MKQFLAIIVTLSSLTLFASNYPPDYCHARVKICEDGPAVVAQVSSGCSSEQYVIGYKKSGLLSHNSFVDAVINFHFSEQSPPIRTTNLRISPDWHNLGFISTANQWTFPGRGGQLSITALSIAFSDGKGNWDSNNSYNYYFPVGSNLPNNCYSVKTNEDLMGRIPLSVWTVINEAMR
ncbi:MAG: hypothetical protein AABY53_04890 [Bdellovibrionota bacterium]